MPGFHEHVEGLDTITPEDETAAVEEEPEVRQVQSEQPAALGLTAQTCPICERVLADLDNTAVNAHIDFCLSKGAIMMATAESSKSSGVQSDKPKVRKKPASRTLDTWKQPKWANEQEKI